MDVTDVAVLDPFSGNAKINGFICDIDGTVAKHGKERGHFEYAKARDDEPNYPVIEAVEAYARVTGRMPIFTTGRPEADGDVNVRELTIDWIVENTIFVPAWFKLVMRPQFITVDYRSADGLTHLKVGDRDFRPDDVVKEELYRTQIEPYCNISVAWDDRDRVVKMWRRLGIPCFQVAEGNF